MKKHIGVGLVLVAVLLTGCQACGDKFQTYSDDPGYLIRDPHFAGYEKASQDLERRYLSKDITYAVYMDEKKALDLKYQGEVEKREVIFERE